MSTEIALAPSEMLNYCDKAPHRNAAICGIGYALPKGRLTNHDLIQRIDSTNEWIMSRVGIASRFITDASEATSDLGVAAARMALADARMGAEDIDLILCATSTPDQLLPSTACRVQAVLGATQAAAMDINAVCSGFVYGMHAATAFLRSNMHRNILLIGADTLSKFLDYDDRSSCILFGDGSGAAVLSTRGRLDLLYSSIGSDGQHGDLITIPAGGSREPTCDETIRTKRHFVRMKGSAIYRLAVRHMVQAAKEAMTATGLRVIDIDLVVPHQANVRIIEAVREAFGIDRSRIVVDLEDTGNTSAASIPVALARHEQQKPLRAGQHVMLLSFGSGVTWGCQVLRVAESSPRNVGIDKCLGLRM